MKIVNGHIFIDVICQLCLEEMISIQPLPKHVLKTAFIDSVQKNYVCFYCQDGRPETPAHGEQP